MTTCVTAYGGEPPVLLETQKIPATALEQWHLAENYYRTARPLAAAADRRLETGWHQEILARRLKMGVIAQGIDQFETNLTWGQVIAESPLLCG